jgi:chromosome segregation ATPase
MKTKALLFLFIIMPLIISAQGFSGPPSMNRANGLNSMMMQQQQMMSMLMRNIESDEQKLDKEVFKKQDLELKIQLLKDKVADLNNQIAQADSSKSPDKELLRQKEKAEKEISKTTSKIEKSEEKLKRSNALIDELQNKIVISKKELEEKKIEKEAKEQIKSAKKAKKENKD